MSVIKVAYYDPFGLWPHVAPTLSNYLPLQSLRFKLPQRPTHIASHLDLDFVPFDPHFVSRSSGSLFQDPMLYLFLMGCDSSLDTYRQVIKPQITEWLQNILLRRDREWLVVLVMNGGDRVSGSNLGVRNLGDSSGLSPPILLLRNGSPVSPPKPTFHGHSLSASSIISQLKGSGSSGDVLVEKVRSDFKDGKRERVYPIKLHDSSLQAADFWRNLTDAFKEILCSTFETNYSGFEEEVKKLDHQRRYPGWNFCTFFNAKECLAHAFEALQMYGESLKVYDELEVVLVQSSKELYEGWFMELGGDLPDDLSSNLLDFTDRPVRDRIATNQISLFEFRMYLFARQMRLLSARIGDLKEFANRALRFVGTFSESFLELKGRNLKNEMFIYVWKYSACTNIFQATEEGLETEVHEDRHNKKDSFNLDLKLSAARSSLLWMAKAQLDRLGILCSLLPLKSPFLLAFEKSKRSELIEQRSASPINLLTCPTLTEIFSNQDTFDSLYLSLSQKIKAECELSGRPRTKLGIHAHMAALHFHRSRFSSAIPLLEGARQYLDEGWFDMAGGSLEYLAEAYTHEGLWQPLVHLCLRVLASTIPEPQHQYFSDKLLEGLRSNPGEISCDMALHLKLDNIARTESSGDFALEINLLSRFAKGMEIELIQAFLKSSDGVWITYMAKNVSMALGHNRILLGCEHPAVGEFTVDALVVKLGALTLSQDFVDHRISFHQDPLVLQMTAGLSSDSLVVEVYSQENQVTKGSLRLEILDQLGELPASGGVPVFIRTKQGQVSAILVETWREEALLALELPFLLPHQSVSVTIPCLAKVGLGAQVAFSCEIAYTNQYGQRIAYRQVLKTKLAEQPFNVQHTWFPKPQSTEYFYALKLRAPQTCLPQRVYLVQIQSIPQDPALFPSAECTLPLGPQQTFTLFPGQSIDYVFDIPKSSQTHVMVQYCSILKEVELGLAELFKPLTLGLPHTAMKLSQLLAQKLLQAGYLSHYAMSGKLQIGWLENVTQVFASEEPALAQTMEEFRRLYTCLDKQIICTLSDHKHLQTFSIKKKLNYPTESICIKVSIDKEIILLGDSCEIVYSLCSNSPLDIIVSINLSPSPDSNYWAISGKTKLSLTLSPNESYPISVISTPTRVGYLRLPQLHIALKEFKDPSPELIYPQLSQQIRVHPPTSTDLTLIKTHPPSSTDSYDHFAPKHLPPSLPTTIHPATSAPGVHKPSPLPVPKLQSPRFNSKLSPFPTTPFSP